MLREKKLRQDRTLISFKLNPTLFFHYASRCDSHLDLCATDDGHSVLKKLTSKTIRRFESYLLLNFVHKTYHI